MAITGAHVLLYTPEPEALRAMLRDVFGWKHVDAGEGWLITVMLTLPGGVEVMLYQPRHPVALDRPA
jgi:hypothetical protein